MRIEECACGGPSIRAMSLKSAQVHIDIHNAGPVHQAWRRARAAQEAYEYERSRLCDETLAAPLTYRDPRRPTAGTTTRDLSGSKPGASAVGGAA